MLLTCQLPDVITDLRESVSAFFAAHEKAIADSIDQKSSRLLCLNWASIKAMLNVVECIRMHNL